eukprot:g8081.t1
MFRSLFGTTAAGEDSSAGVTGGGGGNPSGQQSGRKDAAQAVSTPSAKDGGGFFQLEPTNASGEESLFGDLEVKPPAADVKPAPMKQPPAETGSAGGVFSAFQFMATPAASASTTEDAAAPLSAVGAGVPMTGDDDDDAPGSGGGGVEMSAFSFLAADDSSRQQQQEAEGAPSGGAEGDRGDGSENIHGDPAGEHQAATPLSSFSFLSEGDRGGSAAASATEKGTTQVKVSSVALPRSSSENSGVDQQYAAGRDSYGGGGSGGLRTPGLASGASSPSSSAQRTGSASVTAEEGTGKKAGGGAVAATAGAAGAGAAVPSWKPASSVVRKKRTARRVGYARDETLTSSSSSAAAAASSPLSMSSAAKVSTADSPLGSPAQTVEGTLPVVATAGGGGISYVSEGGSGSNYSAPPISLAKKGASGSGSGEGEGGAMDDSQVAEAAAMAALAASMAPGEIQGARARGDMIQGSSHGASSHGTSSSTTSSATGGSGGGGGGAAAGTPANVRPMALKKPPSFISKFKGLLSHSSSKSDCSPTTASAAGRRSPRSFPEDTTEDMTDSAEPPASSSQARGGGEGGYVRPAFSAAGPERGSTAVQEMREELSVVVAGFQAKTRVLSNRMTEAASEKAALECSRTSVGNTHAEGVRRLAEAESEQQRLADEEEYEKAAELSVEIESLKEESASSARRLRELEEDEADLDRSSSEARSELLDAVQEAARALKVFQGRQDAKLGRLVSQRAAQFEEENRRMNTEEERIALEKTHVERDWAHLEEELSQTESAISVQTGGEDERMSKLRLMRMELEGEVKELEAQLEAKRGALREVMTGIDEADGRIAAVRNKFERQLQRLRERERLVEVSRQDCQKEEEALLADRARHREQMEQATQEQQGLQEALEGIKEDVSLAEMLQSTLAKHWRSEPRAGGGGGSGGGRQGDDAAPTRDDEDGDRDDALASLRSEVEAARSRYELKARGVAALEERKEELTAESARNADALPTLEQKKRAAVGAKNYKEAGHVSRQIKDTERRQQEVAELLSELEQSVAERSTARQELHATKAELTQAEEALRVAEEAVAVSRIAALERRAKPVRKATRAVRARGAAGGLRDTAEGLLVLQLSSLDAEARDISARHGLAPPELSQPQPGDSDDDDDGGAGGGDGRQDVATGSAGGLEGEESAEEGKKADEVPADAGSERGDKNESSPLEDADAMESVQPVDQDDPAVVAARELIEMESTEVERDLADLEARLEAALAEEDYDEAAEVDAQMTQVRARLADFAAQAAALAQPRAASSKADPAHDNSGNGGGRGDGGPGDEGSASPPPSGTGEQQPAEEAADPDAGDGGIDNQGGGGGDQDGAVDGSGGGDGVGDGGGDDASVAVEGRAEAEPEREGAVADGPAEASPGQEAGADSAEEGGDGVPASNAEVSATTPSTAEGSVDEADIDVPTGAGETEGGAVQAQASPLGGEEEDGSSASRGGEREADGVEEASAGPGEEAGVVDV